MTVCASCHKSVKVYVSLNGLDRKVFCFKPECQAALGKAVDEALTEALIHREICSFQEPLGLCGRFGIAATIDFGYCEDHSAMRCACGKQAVRRCGWDLSGNMRYRRCDVPVCEEHSVCQVHEQEQKDIVRTREEYGRLHPDPPTH